MKNYIFFLFIGFLFNIFEASAQPPAVTLDFELGSNTICAGETVQLRAVATFNPPRTGEYRILWRQNGTFVKEGSNAIDENTYLRTAFLVNGTIEAQVEGTTATATINVTPAPDAGISNTTFLCNKIGSLNLIDFLNGTPDAGGIWTRSNGTVFDGQFNTVTDEPGVFIYTISGSGPCGDTNASVTIKPCGENDFDGDGVLNSVDLDDDNDGIPDNDEAAYCTGSIGLSKTQFSLEETFGVGIPTRNAFVSPKLGYFIGAPQDDITNPASPNGQYNVATSLHMLNYEGGNAVFMATNQNGNVDADGDTNGRFLAINMLTSAFGLNDPIYEQTDLPVIQGSQNVISMSIANLSDKLDEVPLNLRIEVIDSNTGLVITDTVTGDPVSRDTGEVPNGGDQWIVYDFPFIPELTVRSVRLRVINLQRTSGPGNDVGIDNIFLSALECDFDKDTFANSADLDSDGDGIYDIIEAGGTDTDNDGKVDGFVDLNNNGLHDPLDPDFTTPGTSYSTIDTDNDGNQDYLDVDSDNDGIIDLIEAQSTSDFVPPSGIDGDFNGVDDVFDLVTGTPLSPIDTNTNNIPDYLDLNSDAPGPGGDCLSDTIEAYDTDQDGIADTIISGVDTDRDGLDEAFDRVVLDRNTQKTNAQNDATLPTDFPDTHDPGGEPDWRESFSGAGGAPVSEVVCSLDPSRDLFELLPATTATTGTWTPIGTAPALTGGHLGTLDRAATTPGTAYEYSYNLGKTFPACPDRSTMVSITFTAEPNAGTSATITTDRTAPIIDLFEVLKGTGAAITPGGTWTPTTLVTAGQFDPGFDLYDTYTYTVGSGVCQKVASVTISERTTVAICATDTPYDLNDLLISSIPRNGTWSPGGSNLIIPENLTPYGTPITYEYTYTESGSTEIAEIEITVFAPPSITPRSDLSSCEAILVPAPQNSDQQFFTQPNGTGTQLFENDSITESTTVFVIETNSSGCFAEDQFEIVVTEEPEIRILRTNGTVCVDNDGNVINTVFVISEPFLDPVEFDFSWTRDGTSIPGSDDFLEVATPGEYVLTYTSILSNCAYQTLPITVIGDTSVSPTQITLEQSSSLLNNNTITVRIAQSGNYEYSLDDESGPYQSSPTFNNVPFGYHLVWVRSLEGGCAPTASEPVAIFGFPKFFTPGGQNPRWNIVDIGEPIPEMEINIFDRYGKLLKTLDPNGPGWDGNFNGKQMPATDYWFYARLENGEEYKSHFSLIR